MALLVSSGPRRSAVPGSDRTKVMLRNDDERVIRAGTMVRTWPGPGALPTRERRAGPRSASTTVAGVLDLRRIRSEADAIRAGLSRRGTDLSLLDRLLDLDERARAVGAEVDELRNQVKVVSKEIELGRASCRDRECQ